ncbi:hypothetical protein L2E82_09940 [Cichorium intybus]|uniref:Uncharacterized protein n=1 Tax=Cichorium intybus TaxID=13427 RepID=A0ACB9GA16_CICIN|nr:hypothetical protein L2E82_09940 [Cichorium intybus]
MGISMGRMTGSFMLNIANKGFYASLFQFVAFTSFGFSDCFYSNIYMFELTGKFLYPLSLQYTRLIKMHSTCCGLEKGDVVDLSPVMGKGFNTDQISPPEDYQSVLVFATRSGFSPIRSLIESGFSADKRSDVRLYYGARNLQRMAYQDRFKSWESSGVTIVPVLSRPTDNWASESGYV